MQTNWMQRLCRKRHWAHRSVDSWIHFQEVSLVFPASLVAARPSVWVAVAPNQRLDQA